MYLTLKYKDQPDQVIKLDAYPRLQVHTGKSLEFSEHHLLSAEFTADDPAEEPKKTSRKK